MKRTPTRAGLVAMGAGVAVLGIALELTPAFETAQRALGDGFGPEGGQTGRSTRILQELGLSADSLGWLGRPADAPSSRAVQPRDLQDGQWLVSIAIPSRSRSRQRP